MAWLVRVMLGLALYGCGEEPPTEADCGSGWLPGDAADVAATPRANRDAEYLALSLDESEVVAREADYRRVVDDLDAIFGLAPHLINVHVGCRPVSAIEVWAYWDVDLFEPIAKGEFEPWQCHAERYGLASWWRIDGLAIAFELDGRFSPKIVDAYRDALLEHDETTDITLGDDFARFGAPPTSCSPEQDITVSATFDDAGELAAREYTFQIDPDNLETWRIVGDRPESAQ